MGAVVFSSSASVASPLVTIDAMTRVSLLSALPSSAGGSTAIGSGARARIPHPHAHTHAHLNNVSLYRPRSMYTRTIAQILYSLEHTYPNPRSLGITTAGSDTTCKISH